MAPTYRTGPAERWVNPAPDVTLAPTLGDACMVTSRAADGRVFVCARPAGHTGMHYGATKGAPVRLGYGR